MIARNVNFAGRESKIIDWYENVPKAIDYYDRGDGITRLNGQMVSFRDFRVESDREELEIILSQLYLLLEKYPSALENETILRKSRNLIEYAKKRNVSLNNCYSYFNKETRNIELPGQVKTKTYGLRILPSNWNNRYSCITISQYESMASGGILSKSELRLKLNAKGLDYINMTYMDDSTYHVYNSDALTYLKPVTTQP